MFLVLLTVFSFLLPFLLLQMHLTVERFLASLESTLKHTLYHPFLIFFSLPLLHIIFFFPLCFSTLKSRFISLTKFANFLGVCNPLAAHLFLFFCSWLQ